MSAALPDFLMENQKYMQTDGNFRLTDDAPIQLKKKFERWNNKNFTCYKAGIKDPWYTWDGQVIEKSERFNRPGFKEE